MYDKEKLIKEFLDIVIRNVEGAAKHGANYENVDVPDGLTRADVEPLLKNAFPECDVKWKWFIQSYQIRWR